MFFRKKKVEKSRPARSTPKSDFGIPGMPGFGVETQEHDADLEAELLALTGGVKSADDDITIGGDDDDDLESELAKIIGSKKSNKTKNHRETAKLTKAPPLRSNFQRTASFLSNTSDDENIDENDPELLDELKMLTTSSDSEIEDDESDDNEVEEKIPSQLEVIQSRLEVYKEAERIAKASNDSSRARRYNRGLKSLEKLLKRAQAGEVVPVSEIPPEISLPKPAAPVIKNTSDSDLKTTEKVASPSTNVVSIPSDCDISAPPVNLPANSDILVAPEKSSCVYPFSEPELSMNEIENKQIEELNVTEDTLEDKQESLTPTAEDPPSNLTPTTSAGIVKEQRVVSMIMRRRDEYKGCALSAKKEGNMSMALDYVRTVKALDKLLQHAESGRVVDESEIPPSPFEKVLAQKSNRPAVKNVPSVPIVAPPLTIIEALNQRLNYYMNAAKQSQTLGQLPVAKKCSDMVKIYQNAIILHKNGKKVPYEKLPTPPGYPPIPLGFSLN